MLTTAKDPKKVRAGIIGAQRRWGERRVIDLRTVDPAVAGVIRSILNAQTHAAAKAEAERESSDPSGPEAA